MSDFRPRVPGQHEIKIERIASLLNISKQSTLAIILDLQLKDMEAEDFVKRFRDALKQNTGKARS
jgi:hypothetical protein